MDRRSERLRPPAHFETARTLLRPVAHSDAQAVFGYASSPAATHFMEFTRQDDLQEAVQFTQRCEACWQDGSAYPWAVLSRATGELMGVVELRVDPPRADFGYIFNERFWGQGLCAEAARPVVEWAAAQPEIYRVWATCHPDNVRSARVLEKLGLTLEARLESWATRPQLNEAAGPCLVFARVR